MKQLLRNLAMTLTAAAILILAAAASIASPTTLALDAAFSYVNAAGKTVSLPAVTPDSPPQAITDKFVGLITYFNFIGINGTIAIPKGTWPITETLYLNHANPAKHAEVGVSLQGAGEADSVIEGAPGYEDIPLVLLGRRIQEPGLDVNALHRPWLTMPLASIPPPAPGQVSPTPYQVYDESVRGEKVGLRTHSSADGIWNASVTIRDAGAWKSGTAYRTGDRVTALGGGQPHSYVCTAPHTATDGASSLDMPDTGLNWRAYWREVDVPATGYFQDSPLASGPLDPATDNRQATYWRNTDQFTLDVLVKDNDAAKMDGDICGVSDSDYASSFTGTIWALTVSPDQGLFFNIVLPNPIKGAVERGDAVRVKLSNPLGEGVHRISVQVDLRANPPTISAWVDGKQQDVTLAAGGRGQGYSRNLGAVVALPAGMRFLPYEHGGLVVGANNRSNWAVQDQDWTFGGLKMSNALRYAVKNAGDAQTTLSGLPPTDQTRYFDNDNSTIALLPLTDTPPADTDFLNPLMSLVKVEEGGASLPPGSSPRFGYGWWLAGQGQYQIGASVRDLTLRCPNARYGAPFSLYLGYGVDMRNVTLDGGYASFDHWPCGSNEYLIRLRNVTMRNASFAGLCNVGQAMYLATDVTIDNCGRQGIYAHQCSLDFDHLTITPSPYSEYAINIPTDQTQFTSLLDVHILPEPTHKWPSRAVITIGYPYYGIIGPGQAIIRGLHAPDMPPHIAMIELPTVQRGWDFPESVLTLEDYDFSVYGGGKLSAFLRVASPRWHGVIGDATRALTAGLDTWLDNRSLVLPWHDGGSYSIDDLVMDNGRIYRCIRAHTDWPRFTGMVLAHRPGVGQNWQQYWREDNTTNFTFVHPDFAALPTTGAWVEGAHILRIPRPMHGADVPAYTEYRCTRGGNAASPDPAQRPLWAVVGPATPAAE